jgi:hypothetical protein
MPACYPFSFLSRVQNPNSVSSIYVYCAFTIYMYASMQVGPGVLEYCRIVGRSFLETLAIEMTTAMTTRPVPFPHRPWSRERYLNCLGLLGLGVFTKYNEFGGQFPGLIPIDHGSQTPYFRENPLFSIFFPFFSRFFCFMRVFFALIWVHFSLNCPILTIFEIFFPDFEDGHEHLGSLR